MSFVYKIIAPKNERKIVHKIDKLCLKTMDQTKDCRWLANFDPQKVHSKAKIEPFLTLINLMSINFLVRTLQCVETSILYLFCP